MSAIEEDIVFGVLPPQSRLIEERLSERFDAKRHVIREVFSTLEDLGLVERVPNKGAIVTELTPAEVLEIYEVRRVLETHAGAITLLPVSTELISRMEAVQTRHEEAVSAERFREVFHLNIDFHRLQYSACPNKHLVQTIHDYARKAHLIRATKYGDQTHMKKVVSQHWAIIEAMKGTDNQKLVELISAHLPGSPEEYIRIYNIRYGGDRRAV
ncbi:GntR family transcriptional regulator [Rhizobium sp. 18055]|uniref:GntR family transcriptional regulator n=1 Tax=Rhizobium sp. 18055 TaxID=2681403 RepID=UPI0013596EC3|nr:GntR family transcriptional regulator [Rhizobium sp. 18055]